MALTVSVEHAVGRFKLAATVEAPDTGVTVLFGAPGTGKSLFLAGVCGLTSPRRLTVDLGGTRLDRLPPERRRVGVVFPDGRLFPHLSVRDNLVFGAKRAPTQRGPTASQMGGLDEIVALLALQKLLPQPPRALTHAERLRVGIGRALLSRPRLVVMDAPLTGLPPAAHPEMLRYLTRVREELTVPMLYATGALAEAVRLADHLVLLEGGRVVAQGALSDLASRVDLALAARPDAAAILHGMVQGHDAGRRLTAVSCGGRVFLAPLSALPAQTRVRLRIAARHVVVAIDAPADSSADNVLPSVIAAIGRDEAGHAALVELDVGGGQLLARLTLEEVARLRLAPGMRVMAMAPAGLVEVMV